MPTFISLHLLNDLQKETEIILQKAITDWQMCATDILLYKQSENNWSATQCLMHLNSYGRYYLPAIQNSIDIAERKRWVAKDSFLPGFIGNWFTELMKPRGEKQVIKKMKSPKEHTPVTNDNSDAVLAEFIEQQETLLKLLERAKNIDVKKAKTPVSISRFIRLATGDTFRFLIAHNQRHVLQAERSMAVARGKQL